MKADVSLPSREVLAALCARLEQRARELQDEVRAYPTPIARCDEQLPKLIERRSRAMAQWREASELEAGAAANGPAWAERVRRLLEDLDRTAGEEGSRSTYR